MTPTLQQSTGTLHCHHDVEQWRSRYALQTLEAVTLIPPMPCQTDALLTVIMNHGAISCMMNSICRESLGPGGHPQEVFKTQILVTTLASVGCPRFSYGLLCEVTY